VVICGTTGESATLTHSEHEELIAHAAAFFPSDLGPNRPQLIAGTGSNSTHEAVAFTEFAASKGVDAVLVITPYYNKPTPRGQVLHFTEVAKGAGEVPVILYNVPGRTALKMGLETILELAEVDNICGIKEASGDLILASEVVRRAPEGFEVISGEDNLTFPLMALGATGVISVSANIVPGLVKEMVELCLKERFAEARAIHQRLFALTEALFAETNPIPVKTAVNLMAGSPAPGGWVWPDAGELRMPLCAMREETLLRLQREMSQLGLLAPSEVGTR
jgi:4-hydroxy-tetrahydrodipicolinate synthase